MVTEFQPSHSAKGAVSMRVSRKAVVLVALISGFVLGSLPAVGASPGADPVLLVYERNPWLMVIGSDSPIFGLYDNGLVIYESGKEATASRFLASSLAPEELQTLLNSLDLEKLFPKYDGQMINATNDTDQPTIELYYFEGDAPRAVAAYGAARTDETVRERIPKPFLQVFDALTSFEAEDASPWLPEFIEVMFWPYEYAPEDSLPWPAEWPGLDDSRTIDRGDGSFSVYLPSSELERFLAFLKSRGQRQAVLVDGRKCAISFRIPFPGE